MAIINLNYTAHNSQVVMNYLTLVGKETIEVRMMQELLTGKTRLM
jgi:hypothetical protein